MLGERWDEGLGKMGQQRGTTTWAMTMKIGDDEDPE